LHAFLRFPMCYMPSQSQPPWFITRIIFDEYYMLWSSVLCNLLQPSTNASLLCPNTFLNTLFSTSDHVPPLVWETKFHAYTK
jgi:hypothetical protein